VVICTDSLRHRLWIRWNRMPKSFWNIDKENAGSRSFSKFFLMITVSELGFFFLQRAVQANRYSESTLDTFLQRFGHDCDPVNTLPGHQSQPPPTPRTWHRAKTHYVNNNLMESPRRRRRRLNGSARSPPLASSTSGINTRQLVARQSHICLPVNVLILYEHPIC